MGLLDITGRNHEPPALYHPSILGHAIEEALRAYVGAKQRTIRDGDGKPKTIGITINGPADELNEEIARNITEAVLKMQDQRPWNMVPANELASGDVFTRYELRNGLPVAEEVTVIDVRPSPRSRAHICVRVTCAGYTPDDMEVTSDFLFWVYRPTREQLLKMLEEP